jgi:hypothetical protein
MKFPQKYNSCPIRLTPLESHWKIKRLWLSCKLKEKSLTLSKREENKMTICALKNLLFDGGEPCCRL